MMALTNAGRPLGAHTARMAPDGTRLEAVPLPPEEALWSLDDENSIIASLMVDTWNTAAVLESLGFDPADLYRDSNRALYLELRRIMATGMEPDTMTAHPQIMARGMADACGGERHILAVADHFRGSHLIASYVRRVQHLAGKRRLLRSLLASIQEVTDGDALQEIQTGLMQRISAVALPDGGKAGHIKTAERLTSSVMRGIHNPTKRLPCWPTGLPDVDRLLSGGLRQGGLYIIGGRPKNGKSTLALAIVIEMLRQGHRAHIDSLEMTDTVDLDTDPGTLRSKDDEVAGDLAKKIMAYLSGVDSLRVTDSPEQLGEAKYRRLHEAHMMAMDWPMTSDARAGRTIDQITQQARRIKAQYPDLHVLMVDHAGIVRPRKGEDRRNAMMGVTNDLKALAKELGIAVVLCAQINRDAVGRVHPLASDLKESGSLEEDCDGAILVMNPKTSGLTPDCTALWLSLPVHRHGPSGDSMWLEFDPTCGQIGLECPDPSPRDEDAPQTRKSSGPNRDWRKK